jgi:L-ascorbate metabolism protein UlaG (beta-lactamase superfamily)
VRFDDLPPISTVLLSHNHYDHCDLRTLGMLADRFDPIVVTPMGNSALVRSAGIRRVEELDWWQEARTSPLPMTLTPAQHFSARSPFDRNRALWGGFLVMAGGPRLFFAVDTAYAPFFRDVREPMQTAFATSTSGSGSARSIWRFCPSARTSRGGSCSPFT